MVFFASGLRMVDERLLILCLFFEIHSKMEPKPSKNCSISSHLVFVLALWWLPFIWGWPELGLAHWGATTNHGHRYAPDQSQPALYRLIICVLNVFCYQLCNRHSYWSSIVLWVKKMSITPNRMLTLDIFTENYVNNQ